MIGRRLTAQLDLGELVQDATDAVTGATQAAFGAFFYNLVDEYGESYTLHALSGVPRAAFDGFGTPAFSETSTVRLDDITQDPRYDCNTPHGGSPLGHLPVCSYLAVPVVSPSSHEVLGGFFFGHPEPARFSARHQQLAEGIAGYTAIALDNARLFAAHRSTAAELTRSMLPVVPSVVDLEIASRYLPAAVGSEVGGDWFDVIELPAGRTAFVIGDVAGRGVKAAAVMGQMRTAVRSYASLDLPPAEVLRHSSELARTTPGAEFVTCFYAVHDPVDRTLIFANAGHPPAVLESPSDGPRLIGEGQGMPLGVGEIFPQDDVEFPVGARLTLYTDGLMESRERAIDDGLAELLGALNTLSHDPSLPAACDRLIEEMTQGRHDDDVALLHVHHVGGQRRVASRPVATDPSAAADARAFVAGILGDWRLTALTDTALTISSELVANAVQHSKQPGELRLHYDGRSLTIEVADRGPAMPQLYHAAIDGEGHRGLFLVDAFASRWGTRMTRRGKVVWAELSAVSATLERPVAAG
ncbi:SpoIIE family protein phosphatase [Kribbella sp. NPDC059898]|uniref:SpoIIE family protein phosphatase n=1 Tax=Kribbella sp. NPDC059898 TaxID=3346995 RepID=UPI00366170AB